MCFGLKLWGFGVLDLRSSSGMEFRVSGSSGVGLGGQGLGASGLGITLPT